MSLQVTESELEGTLEYIDVVNNEGAMLETGGGQPDGERFGNGYYVEPTISSDVDNDLRITQEEVFGPVLAVIEVDGFGEGLETANGINYGLSASIVMDDHTEAERFVDEVKAGVAKVNDKATGLEPYLPSAASSAPRPRPGAIKVTRNRLLYEIEKTIYDGFKGRS